MLGMLVLLAMVIMAGRWWSHREDREQLHAEADEYLRNLWFPDTDDHPKGGGAR